MGGTGTWLLYGRSSPYEEKAEPAALRKRYYSKLTLRTSLGTKTAVSYRLIMTDQPTQRPPQERQLVLQSLVEESALSGYPLRNETDFQKISKAGELAIGRLNMLSDAGLGSTIPPFRSRNCHDLEGALTCFASRGSRASSQSPQRDG